MSAPYLPPLLMRLLWWLWLLVLAGVVLFFGRPVLIPLATAVLLSLLLATPVRWLERRRIPSVLAILTMEFLMVALAAALLTLLTMQLVTLARDLNLLQAQLTARFNQLQQWIAETTGLSIEQQWSYLTKAGVSLLGLAQTAIQSVLSLTTGVLVFIALQVVFIFFFLYYRQHIRRFLLLWVPAGHHQRAAHVIYQISLITRKYLTGLLAVVAILSVLNFGLFSAIGVPHAWFFALLAAVLNIVPYVGIWIGTLLPVAMMWLTQNALSPLVLIVAGIWFIQQVDNHFLTPRIAGKQVALNPMASVLALFVGGMLWGVAGLILAIPLLGIAKIIFDNIEELTPLGYLMGEDKSRTPANVPRPISWWPFRKKP